MGTTTLITIDATDVPWTSTLSDLRGTETYGLRSFPTPAAYRALVADLAARPGAPDAGRLAALAQRDWHVRGQTGCMFARLAARSADVLRWDYIVTTDDGPATLAKVDELVAAAVADPAVEVVSVLLPHIGTGPDAVDLLRSLAAHTAFWLERDEMIDGVTRLHLRYPVSNEVQAWVMAFTPFPWVPNTRRGPYVELAIRTKVKPEWIFHRLTQDRDVAHLADVPLMMSDRHWEDRWRSTLARTRMILGGEPDDISAAKATLAVPVDAAGRRLRQRDHGRCPVHENGVRAADAAQPAP